MTVGCSSYITVLPAYTFHKKTSGVGGHLLIYISDQCLDSLCVALIRSGRLDFQRERRLRLRPEYGCGVGDECMSCDVCR